MNDGTSWITVARRADLSAGKIKGVKADGKAIALYNLDGEFYATDNVCTHAYAELSDGYLERGLIVCPLHAGCFDVKTGKAVEPPAEEDLKTYPVRVVGEDIQIGL
jgi:nitrite reductase/ring-hydroxylating ferredoxin subunit